MLLLTSVLLTLTLILCGAYAGMVLMCQIGVLPAMRDLKPHAYADTWRAMVTYLDRSMPSYKGSLLLVNAATLTLLIIQHHTQLAVATCLSLLFSVAGLVATVRGQLPLNAQIKATSADTPDNVLIAIREQTVRGFAVRFYLAAISFIALSVGVIFWPLR